MQVKQSTGVTKESGGNELPSLNCSKTITIVNGAFYYKKILERKNRENHILYRGKET